MQALFSETREAATSRTWSRGVELARAGAVAWVRRENDEIVLRVSVPRRASAPTVTIWPDDQEWACDCGSAEDPCEHVAAAVIALKRGLNENTDRPAALAMGHIGYRFSRTADGLALQRVGVSGGDTFPLTHTLIDAAKSKAARIAPSKRDLAIELALGQVHRKRALPSIVLRNVLDILEDGDDVQLDGTPVHIAGPTPALRALLTREGNGYRLTAGANPANEVFSNGAMFDENGALRSTVATTIPAAELASLKAGVQFDASDAPRLVSDVLPQLRKQMTVAIATDVQLPEISNALPQACVTLTAEGTRLRAVATLVYGSPPIARITGGELIALPSATDTVVKRDATAENRLQTRLQTELNLRLGVPNDFHGHDALAWAARLKTMRWLTIEGDVIHRFVHAGTLTPKLQVDADRFEVTFGTSGESTPTAVDAKAVMQAWQTDSDLVALPDGRLGTLPADWLARFGDRVAMLLALRDTNGAVQPAGRPDLARLCAELDHTPPADLKQFAERLANIDQIPKATLPQLNARLRDYQQTGINWLYFLRNTQLGALLADDMGLGKTLQAIAALPAKGTLIVAPTSVLRNWVDEIARFRPQLSCCLYHGANRKFDKTADVIVTSYAILRLDIDRLSQRNWQSVVLDEAQLIRNPESQTAQAAFALRASWRLALTGTPVENRLEDLWSLFHFLNRGLLAGRATFVDRYARPIAQGDSAAAQRLRDRIRPFVLRRKKSDVAPELPPRTEIELRCELSTPERETYQSVHAATRTEVLRQLELGKVNVMGALAALLRLRQAACHPALLPGQSANTSAKTTLLCEYLERTVEAQHKALVFSQWTSLLDLIEPQLKARNLPFLRLDGTTKDRASVVDQFQRDDGPPVMLISLKAGGTGITLTQADHVFLMDPWWNPAVEQQAADRAHRIGQTQQVLIYRLIAADTVEERILALQQRKQLTADAALADADQSAGLTRQDLLDLLDG